MPHTPPLCRQGGNLPSCLSHGDISVLDEGLWQRSPCLFKCLQHPFERFPRGVGSDRLKADARLVLSIDDKSKAERKMMPVLHGDVVVMEHRAILCSERNICVWCLRAPSGGVRGKWPANSPVRPRVEYRVHYTDRISKLHN